FLFPQKRDISGVAAPPPPPLPGFGRRLAPHLLPWLRPPRRAPPSPLAPVAASCPTFSPRSGRGPAPHLLPGSGRRPVPHLLPPAPTVPHASPSPSAPAVAPRPTFSLGSGRRLIPHHLVPLAAPHPPSPSPAAPICSAPAAPIPSAPTPRSPPASSRRRPLPFLLASRSHVERLLPAPSSLQTTQSRQPPPPPVLVQRRPCTRFKELTVRRKGDAKVRQLPRCHPGPSRRPLVRPFVNGEKKTDVVLLLAVLWRRVNRKLQQRTKKKKKI
uniref:Uncharacterized protein n=1 Tax=Aegilops tauschii subsp. strangulata TaxID=200361 RepID=A0A453K256_AEGTS